MTHVNPHYLLFSEADDSSESGAGGRWRFLLEPLNGSTPFEAADAEPDTNGERLELLAVVRGLEALDQPSRVTLITNSRYVTRGLRFGLETWRECDWQWERFGEMSPIKNDDLWRRVDRALNFHEVDCRNWRFDAAHQDAPAESAGPREEGTAASAVTPKRRGPSKWFRARLSNANQASPSVTEAARE